MIHLHVQHVHLLFENGELLFRGRPFRGGLIHVSAKSMRCITILGRLD